MFKFENIKDLRIYKNRKFFIHSLQGNKKFDNLFILAGMTKEDTLSVINSSLIDSRFIPGYFIDKVVTTNVNGVLKKQRLDLREEYNDIRAKAPYVTRTFLSLAQYKNINTFYDIRTQNDIFFNQSRTGSVARRAELYGEYLKRIVDNPNFASYKNKRIIIPVDNYGVGRQDASPISCMLFLLIFSEEKFHKYFDGMEVILISEQYKILVKFNCKNIDRRAVPRFKNILTIVNKLKTRQKLTPEEQLLFDETDQQIESQKPVEVHDTAVAKVMHTLAQSVTGYANPYDDLDSSQIETLDKAEQIAQRIYEQNEDMDEEELMNELNADPEFVNFMGEIANEQITAKSKHLNTKRNELIRKEHSTQRINNQGKTVAEILNNLETRKMDREEYDIPVSNKLMKSSTLKDFEVSYNKKQKDKDTVAILNSFSKNKNIPLYIRKLERYDSSTAFDKKETWHVEFEDENRVRHSVTFDMPLFIDDHFLYLSESKKSISHQLLLLPIVKTDADTVQCTTNYNKCFIDRFGHKISPKIERLKKLISTSKSKNISFISGNSLSVNEKYLTNMDFDELAATFAALECGETRFVFNQQELRDEIRNSDIDIEYLTDEELPIGFDGKKLLVLNVNTGIVKGSTLDLPDFIIEKMSKADPSIEAELNKVTIGKKYVYSRIRIMGRGFGLILFLAFNIGLTAVLKRAKIKHSFSEKRRRLSIQDKNYVGEIKFKDGYLYYDLYPFRNSLLVNALQDIPTENYDYKDFDSKEVYLNLFDTLFGSRNTAKGFSNFIELFLDPITLEVCKDYNIPTDFTDFFLYANALLEDNSFTPERDMSLYRIRSNEIINGILYKVLADAYAKYSNTANNTNPVKMSIPRDKVIKEINTCTIISDYSCINPIAEAEAYGSITYKGPSGLNLDSAFTLDKRSYDQSMMGLMGMSSPYNNKVGISRQLSFNPRITNNRGYIIPGDPSLKGLDVANVLTPAEILTPFAANHDDSPRTA